MFYSHEILANPQYGVSTIWILATVGNKSVTKKVSKKAIEDVDLARACDKILRPGAPIALRLQAGLLFGVSKVYQRKCQYMLTDVQRIQEHMMSFLRSYGANQVDPDQTRARQVVGSPALQRVIPRIQRLTKANRVLARPENVLIMDDPSFRLDEIIIPDPEDEMFFLSQQTSQATNKTSSQMSPPHSFLSGGSSSGNDNFPFQFDLPESSLLGSQNSQQGLQGLSSAQKPAKMAFDEENFGNDAGDDMDLGLEIDADGNIFEDADAAPAVTDYEANLPANSAAHSPDVSPTKQQPHQDEQGDILMMDEEALPDADALPAGQTTEKNNENDVPAESEQNHPPAPSRQKKRKVIHADSEIEIHRNELKRWQTEYLQNCGPQEQRTVSSSQAKENAIHLTFGLGIGNIGQSMGIPGIVHPLAMEFSGDSLFTAFTGLEVFEKTTSRKRGRPAKGEKKDEFEEPEERRVRPRLEENGNEEQHHQEENDGLILDDAPEVGLNQSPPEIGREAQSAMDDHPSSAMPWNRGSSVMHGSSVQKAGSIQRGREPSSPLRGRGEDQEIVRYSSDVEMGGIDFGDGGHHSDDSFGSMAGPIMAQDALAEKESTQDQNMKLREALDREGNNFLGFVENMMPEHGERRHDEDFERRRKWIDFDDVFVPRDTPRATAAQAFYHVLTLVTKGQMLVEQDGEGKEPFGGIHMGLEMPL